MSATRPGELASTLAGSHPLGMVLFGALLLVTLLPGLASAQQSEADVFNAQAIVAYQEKRYEDALSALREALALDANNVDALYYTGLVRVATGQLDAAAEALEQARTRAPEDEAVLYMLGVVYFSQQKYDRAQPLLERVFARQPKLDSLGYYVGFMRYRNKDYQGALRAFRAGAAADPNIQQLTRFYTGLALAVLGLPEQATAAIDEALSLQPASPLTGPTERLRSAVTAARDKEGRFKAELRVGGFFDDNVAVNPVSRNDPVVQALRQRRHESPGALAALRLDYAFLRAGAFEVTATYAAFTTYNTDLPRFSIVDQLFGVTGTYRGALGALPYQLALPYTYDYLMLGGHDYVQRHTVTPYATLVEGSHNLTALQLRYQHKEFAHEHDLPPEEKRDGNNWMAGFVHIFRFEGDKLLLKVGYQWDLDDTRGSNYSYFGHRPLAGGQYTLPWAGLRLKYDVDVHLRDYRFRNTLFPLEDPGTTKRSDTEWTHLAEIALPLPGNITLSATYQADLNRSNLAVYHYTRHVYSLVAIWSY